MGLLDYSQEQCLSPLENFIKCGKLSVIVAYVAYLYRSSCVMIWSCSWKWTDSGLATVVVDCVVIFATFLHSGGFFLVGSFPFPLPLTCFLKEAF